MDSLNIRELENLKMQLHYDKNDGIFYWKNIKLRSKYKIGDIAGCINKKSGYIQIRLNQKNIFST